MFNGIFNVNVNVSRRTSTGTDSLGNPIYGQPTSGSGWSTIYTAMPARLAFSAKELQWGQTGERPTPNGIMYYQAAYALQEEDRVLTAEGIEYVVTSIAIAYSPMPTVVDHYEAILSLP